MILNNPRLFHYLEGMEDFESIMDSIDFALVIKKATTLHNWTQLFVCWQFTLSIIFTYFRLLHNMQHKNHVPM